MNRSLVIAAASMFAAGTIGVAAHAQATHNCYGINACQGQSACKSSMAACKGMNMCKGKGLTVTGTALECTALGGRPLT